MSSTNIADEKITKHAKSETKGQAVSSLRRPSQEEIRRRAFAIHIERGRIHGCDLDDWLQAERELESPARKGNTIGEEQKI
jgi:hypothetical protein